MNAAQKTTLSYFKWAFIVTVVGLILGGYLGWEMTGTVSGTATIFFICAVLAVLEISLSFDNAIVNANKLKEMTPVWQHRFLTWGILIAVFGMRIVFPLLIVVVAPMSAPGPRLSWPPRSRNVIPRSCVTPICRSLLSAAPS